MSQRKFISKEELSMMWRYLFYTFAIAWGTEFLLIMLYRFNLLSENITLFLYFTAIGFGAGMAPAYAAFIVQRKQTGIKLKAFCKQVFHTSNMRRSIVFLLLFAVIQFAACIVQESYLGNPWYLFILFIPMMIWGGGLEEIGWRGVFQPLLEKRFSFLAAAFIEGVVWGVWHLPLWFIPNSTQGDMNFIALYPVLYYLGIDPCGCLSADKVHLGNNLNPCLGEHRFRWNVYTHFFEQFSKRKNACCLCFTDSSHYADIVN